MGEILKGEYFTGRFLIMLIIVFLFLVGFLFVSANQSYLSASPEVANQTRQQVEQERQTITFQAILLNNLLVSLSLLMPAIGLLPFLIVWNNTGQVIGLLSLAYNIPPSSYILNLTVLAFPEIAGYTFLIVENIYVTFLALTRTGAKQRIITHSWKSFIIYLVLLFIGAISEAVMLG